MKLPLAKVNRWGAAGVAIVAMFALVLWPLCVSVCSGNSCGAIATSAPENDDCHAGRNQGGASHDVLTAMKTCRAGDSVAALPKSQSEKSLASARESALLHPAFQVDSNDSLALTIATSVRWCDQSSAGELLEDSFQTVVLRI